MGYYLGIDVGAARTVAAVARGSDDPVETVDLDGDDGGVASVLHLGEDGALAVGTAAEGFVGTEPERVVRGFPGRIGDDAMLLADEPWAPEELTAWLVRWVVDRVAAREGGPATAVAVTHPAAGDADRTRLLGAAIAEQDLEVAFATPDVDGDAPDAAARAVAVALRSAGPPASVDGGGSGRHAAVTSSSAALPAVDGGAASVPDVDAPDGVVATDGAADEEPPGGATADPDPPTVDPARDDAPAAGWEVPSPRSHESGAHPAEPGEPVTMNLERDRLGFTGGMGATNTAGLLSGYTPPHGTPAAWPGRGATVTGRAVALPAQRSDSGAWTAVADLEDDAPDIAAALAGPATVVGAPQRVAAPRRRNNPTVLVTAGGVGAVVAVVGTLLLWPGPRSTDVGTRPVAAVPAQTADPAVDPTADPGAPVELTPAPTHRARPPVPRTRRPLPPVLPTASVAPSTTETAPPTDTTPPTDPTTATTAPSTTDTTAAPTTTRTGR